MLPGPFNTHGLKVIQRVVTTSRLMALTGGDVYGDISDIAYLLDQTDYLIALILDDTEEVAEFERILRKIEDKYPGILSNLIGYFYGA